MTHTARASASGPKREVKFFRPFEKRPQQANNAGRKIIDPHQGPPPQSGVRDTKFFAKLSSKESGERKRGKRGRMVAEERVLW